MEALRTFQYPRVCCAECVAGGAGEGSEELSRDGVCAQSVLSTSGGDVITPQLGHLSALCPSPFCGTLSPWDL